MSTFDNPSKPKQGLAEPAYPSALDLHSLPLQQSILDGRAVCHVEEKSFATPQGVVDCLWYRTEGVRSALGLEELHLLLRRSNEHGLFAVPTEPMMFIDNMIRVAMDGHTQICPGSWHTINRPLLDVFRGVVYTPASIHSTLAEHPQGLVVNPLTSEEFEALKESGPLRLVALLGRQRQYFPWPPWTDPLRPTLGMEGIRERSIMPKLPRVGAWQATVTRCGQTLLIEAPRYLRDTLTPLLVKHGCLALMTGLSAHADSCLSWDGNGNGVAVARGETAERIAGCCVIFARTPDQGNAVGVREDGFTVQLLPDAWIKFLDAVATCEPFDLPLENGCRIRLRWNDGD